MNTKAEKILNRPPELCLSDKMPMGKYKGRSIEEITRWDPQYLNWFNDNVSIFSLSDQVVILLPEKEKATWREDIRYEASEADIY